MNGSNEITSLLIAWKEGDQQALEQLLPLVELELRKIAHAHMRREKENHTLQTTALINEAYLRLVDANNINWQNRAQFFGISAKIMRRILINYARDRAAQKRGGNVIHVSLEEGTILSPEKSFELLALNEALEKLARFDKTKCRIVELRSFGGLTAEETAEVLGLSTATINLYWRLAKAWLACELEK